MNVVDTLDIEKMRQVVINFINDSPCHWEFSGAVQMTQLALLQELSTRLEKLEEAVWALKQEGLPTWAPRD